MHLFSLILQLFANLFGLTASVLEIVQLLEQIWRQTGN